jgi:hypothetical protein
MEITIPRNFDPRETPWYLEVLDSPARWKVLTCHRRARKTTLAAAELVRHKFRDAGNVLYLAPYREQARKLVWEAPAMLQKFLPPEVWAGRNNTDMKLETPNGGHLYVSGADNYESFRGMDLRYVVFDEWDDQDPDLWPNVFQPILGVNGGKALFIGTLKGKADLWAKLQYSLTSGDPEWYGRILKASESGIIPPSVLESIRRTMPESAFMQEFECEPMASGSAVFREARSLVLPKAAPFHPQHRYRMGADLAKRRDFTVIAAVDISDPRFPVIPLERFNGIDWSVQRRMIEAAYRRMNRPVGFVDSTGVGDPIVEDLEKSCPNLSGYRFTGPSREELLNNLMIVIENRRIALPPDEGLMAELESFRWVPNRRTDGPDSRVKWRAEAAPGMTDDRVMALALACWGLPDRQSDQVNERQESPKRPKTYYRRNFGINQDNQ